MYGCLLLVITTAIMDSYSKTNPAHCAHCFKNNIRKESSVMHCTMFYALPFLTAN